MRVLFVCDLLVCYDFKIKKESNARRALYRDRERESHLIREDDAYYAIIATLRWQLYNAS